MEDTVEFDEVPFEFVDRDKELTMPERILHKITMGETLGNEFMIATFGNVFHIAKNVLGVMSHVISDVMSLGMEKLQCLKDLFTKLPW